MAESRVCVVRRSLWSSITDENEQTVRKNLWDSIPGLWSQMENELFSFSFTTCVMGVTRDTCLEALCKTVPKSEGMSPMEV